MDVEFQLTVKAVECPWCAAGSAPDATCACKPIVVPEPTIPNTQVFSTKDLTESEYTIGLELGQAMILREWSTEGKFVWNLMSLTETTTKIKCFEVADSYEGTYYRQVMLKASTADCKWNYMFTNDDGNML